MGFFAVQQKTETNLPKGLSLEFLHRHGCQVCPLYKCPGNKHPDMKASGSPKPLVYILGEGPGKEEDAKAKHFVGKAGRFLRKYIPDDWLQDIRWNNVVRSRPPNNREPTNVEIEACRPSIITDIEKSKPKAIFGFGNIPLYWALGESGITKWSGKRVPIKVGNHSCWFFPILHPSGVLRSMDQYGRSDEDFKFQLDVRNAFDSIDDLPEPVVHTEEDALRGVETITGHETDALARVFGILENEMWNAEIVGYDLETNALRPYGEDAKLLSASFSTGDHTLAFAINHKDNGWSKEERIELKKGLRHFLSTAPCRKIAFNLPFEMEWSAVILKDKDMLWGSKWGDSMLQAYVLNPLRADMRLGHLSLEVLVLEHFGINIKDMAKVNRKNLAAEPLEKLLPYNGVDAKYHLLLFLEQRNTIKKAKLGKVYARMLRRVPTAVLTQIKGIPFSEEVVAEFEEKYTKRVNRRLAEMRMLPGVKRFSKVVGHEFNPGSNHDCKALITKVLDIPLEKGADEEALSTIKDPAGKAFAKILLAWRKATKLRSTYVLSAGAGRIWPDKLLHQLLNLMRVVTSRTSSADPNAQNWPRRGPGKVVRKQIRPKADEVIVAIDYSGIQARNVAMEANDEQLVKAFWDHYDIHAEWTERLIRICPEFIKEGPKAVIRDKDLFKAYRSRVKNEFVFPSFFGASAKSVSGYLGVPIEVGEELREQFWDDFKDVPAWHERLHKHYAKYGWIAGLSGFRHPAPIAHNEKINYPIQADEAAIVCEAMARLSEKGDDLLQANLMIHDDLSFVLPKKKVDHYLPLILEEMLRINFEWINVPLACEVSIGPDWYDLSKLGEYESIETGGYKQI